MEPALEHSKPDCGAFPDGNVAKPPCCRAGWRFGASGLHCTEAGRCSIDSIVLGQFVQGSFSRLLGLHEARVESGSA